MKAPLTYFKYRAGFVTLVLIFSFAANVYSAGFTNSTYAYSLPITLKTTTLGISGNLTSFPYLVTITDPSLVISSTACNNKVQFPNGPAYDFAFVDNATTTEVPYQVVSYDQTAGTLLVWVQVPTLTHSTNNLLTFYFGSATAPATHTTAFYQSTWPSDYLAVYHMDEGSSSATALDATTNVNNGTQTSTTVATGKIGSAYSFNGSTSKIAAGTATGIGGNFTFSAWVYVNTLQASQGIVTDENLLSGGRLGLYTSGGNVKAGVEAKTTVLTISDLLSSGGTSLSAGTWYYVQGVCSTALITTTQTYVNGVADRSTTGLSLSITPGPILIGQDYGGVNIMNGIIDEVRISNVAKSADWIKAEYVDQNNPAAVCSSGSLTVYSTFAAAIPGGLTYTWTGGTSSAPTLAANWTNTTTGTASQLPAFDGTATLIIGTGTFSPSLTADESVFGLTVNSGATLNLNGHNLNIACNLNNTGTGAINWGSNTSSGITWNGSAAAQSYNGGTTTGYARVGNMVINNSASGTVTINSDTLDIYNQLTMTNGNLVVSPGAIVNIKSNAEQTANVAPIASGSSITGSVNVERYITGGTAATRTWRLMSSPIYNTTGTYNFASNLLQNLIVTGPGGTGAGFDPPASWGVSYSINGPTILTYSAGLFYNLASYTQTAQVGTGFYFYFRGDRTHNLASKLVRVSGSYAIPDVNTIGLWTGTLNQGTQTLSLSGANISFCVGNPYACTINANNLTGTNLTTTTGNINVWICNPLQNNTSSTIAAGNPYIASGQGFFVKSSSASTGSIVFSESMKDVTPAHQPGYTGSPAVPLNMSVVQHTGQDSYIRLRMIQDSSHSDLAYIRFNENYKAGFDSTEDIGDMNASGQTVFFGSMTSDSVEVDVNSMPAVQKKLSFYLSVNASTSGNYTIKKLDLVGIDELYDVWLVDHYKNDTINLRTADTTTFAIDKTKPLTYGNSRFEIAIIEKVLPPYQLISFTGKRVLLNNQLTWKTKNEYFYTTFDLQRSVDNGVTYNDIQTIQSDSTGSYSYIDKKTADTKLMYRLQQTDINNNITYSSVVILQGGINNLVQFDVFPNPTASSIQFRLRQEARLPLKMNIYNSEGILVLSTVFNANTGIQNVSNLSHGSYILDLVDSNTSKDLGMVKFIKL